MSASGGLLPIAPCGLTAAGHNLRLACRCPRLRPPNPAWTGLLTDFRGRSSVENISNILDKSAKIELQFLACYAEMVFQLIHTFLKPHER